MVLTGEAFFQVKKDARKPFIVKSDSVRITVLGTSFDVCAYADDDINVAVKTGKVKVAMNRNNNLSEVTLLPGEQATCDKRENIITKANVELKDIAAWEDNTLVFRYVPFSKALKKIERNYNVKISCKDSMLLGRTIKSTYHDTQIKTVLEDLKFILGFDYSFITKDSIIIGK